MFFRRISVLFLFCLFLQTEPNLVQSLKNEALANQPTFNSLTELCRVAPKRLSGSAGAEIAVQWAKAEMKALGLENVRLEAVQVPHWERGPVEALRFQDAKLAETFPLPVTALGGSVGTNGPLTAQVIEVQSFEELQKKAALAKGKFIFFNRAFDNTLANPFEAYSGAVNQRSRGAIEAAKVGAIGAIVRSMTNRLDDFPHTGAMRYDENIPQIPSLAVSTLGAERLSHLLKRDPNLKLEMELSCQTFPDTTSYNVVGELKGSQFPEQILVVGGHLDAWDLAQGAHDDGAGVCQSMHALGLLKKTGFIPKRTLRVVCFMNEENGLRGGRGYYEQHLAEMDRHVLAMESDRGGFTPRGFGTDASGPVMEAFRQIVAELSEIGADHIELGHGGADIGPMAKSGVIQVGYIPDAQRYFDFHHAATDTIDGVNPRELELGTVAMAAFLYRAAGLENLPKNPVTHESE
ncbi:MAG: M28 family peptidase [Acidobacteria bacterium]|nr:M28 family peptidase [Acidobacteriota bacterium]